MSTITALTLITLGLLAMVAALVLVVLGTAVRPNLLRRRTGMIRTGRAELADLLATGRPASSRPLVTEGMTLPTLRDGELMALFREFGVSLVGESRALLHDLAEEVGLATAVRGRLRSRRWRHRLRAVRFVGDVGLAGVDVTTLLGDPVACVRALAARTAANLQQAAAVDGLVAMLTDSDGRCRFEARDALVRLGTPAVPELVRLLDGSDERLHAAVLQIAALARDPAYVPAATRILAAGAPRLRALAAAALGSSGDPSAAGPLRAALTAPDAVVRRAVAAALADLGDWRAAPMLAELLGDAAWLVRREAGLALLRLTPPGRVMLQVVADRAADDRAAALAAQLLYLSDSEPAGVPR